MYNINDDTIINSNTIIIIMSSYLHRGFANTFEWCKKRAVISILHVTLW